MKYAFVLIVATFISSYSSAQQDSAFHPAQKDTVHQNALTYDIHTTNGHLQLSPANGWRKDTLTGAFKRLSKPPYHGGVYKVQRKGEPLIGYNYLNGKLHTGEVSHYTFNNNGNRFLDFKGETVEGLLDGTATIYDPTNTIYVKHEGEFKSGERVGTWKSYGKSGKHIRSVEYIAGSIFPQNIVLLHENGMLWQTITYSAPILILKSVRYDEKGARIDQEYLISSSHATQAPFDHVATYNYTAYDTDSKVTARGKLKYRPGISRRKIGSWLYYDKNGDVIDTAVFKSD